MFIRELDKNSCDSIAFLSQKISQMTTGKEEEDDDRPATVDKCENLFIAKKLIYFSFQSKRKEKEFELFWGRLKQTVNAKDRGIFSNQEIPSEVVLQSIDLSKAQSLDQAMDMIGTSVRIYSCSVQVFKRL